MWLRGEWLVPHLKGAPYSDKGPLLFWLIDAGWWALGVREVWPRLVSPLCAGVSLWMTARLARALWPERTAIAGRAPLLLCGAFLFAAFSTVLIADGVLMMLVLLAVSSLERASRRRDLLGFAGFGTAVGLGILTKGPAALLHCVPLALAAPWWSASAAPRSWARWYGALGVSILWAVLIALAWALPAARAGGPAYADAILWHQTAGRVVRSFAHAHPWWWYLALSPVLILPYSLWPRLWCAVAARWRNVANEPGGRFCLVWISAVLIGFSLISGKQLHYVLPLLVPCVLLAARLLDEEVSAAARGDHAVIALPLLVAGIAVGLAPLVPIVGAHFRELPPVVELLADVPWWLGVFLLGGGVWAWRRRGRSADGAILEIALSACLVLSVGHLAVFRALGPAYDLSAVADHLRIAERQGRPIAHVGNYAGQFAFTGRLRSTPEEIQASEVDDWFRRHPDGVVIGYSRAAIAAIPPSPELVRPYRGQSVVLWTRESFRAHSSPLG
jgi:4-amino-4-deoxy-L-arabinose transferase-like glycosyltransferase